MRKKPKRTKKYEQTIKRLGKQPRQVLREFKLYNDQFQYFEGILDSENNEKVNDKTVVYTSEVAVNIDGVCDIILSLSFKLTRNTKIMET